MARFVDPFEDMDRMLASVGSRWRGGGMPLGAFGKDGESRLRFGVSGAAAD